MSRRALLRRERAARKSRSRCWRPRSPPPVVFFPVTLLAGVQQEFLFSAMALAVVVSLFASYVVAMTVVPLFCARYLKLDKSAPGELRPAGSAVSRLGTRFQESFNGGFNRMLALYQTLVLWVLRAPATILVLFFVAFGASLLLYTRLGFAYFPQTDAGQFVITFKAPSGTRLGVTEREAAGLEDLIYAKTVRPEDLQHHRRQHRRRQRVFGGLHHQRRHAYGFRSGGPDAGTPRGQLRVHSRTQAPHRQRHARDPRRFSPLAALVDAVVSMGAPAPLDVQIVGANLDADNRIAQSIAARLRESPDDSGCLHAAGSGLPVPLRIDVDRLHAAKLGLTEREVLTNVITSLTSNQMIAPNLWIDPRNGNNYFLTVQYPESQIRSIQDLRSIPLHAEGSGDPTRLDMIANIQRIQAPTEVDHYQIRRKLDIYARPASEDLGAAAKFRFAARFAREEIPSNISVTLRGSAGGHGCVVPQFRHRPAALGGPAVPHSGRAVPFLQRSVHHPAGATARHRRRPGHPRCSPAPR